MDAPRPQPPWIAVGKILGVLLMLGPVYGLLGTAYGMRQAFGTLQAGGIGDPSALAGGVRAAFAFTAFGCCALPIGLVIFLVTIRSERRLRTNLPPSLPPRTV